jgi:hypothetical protein
LAEPRPDILPRMPFFRDFFRAKAPPPDEQPVGPFPRVFITPRALENFLAFERKRGGTACVLMTRAADGHFDHGVTPYANLPHDDLVRIACDAMPAYIRRGTEEDTAGFLIDHGPSAKVTINFPWSDTTASRPGHLRLSFERLNLLHPELLLDSAGDDASLALAHIACQLLLGDTNPALVVALKPDLIVSAYAEDLDCVVLLKFPPDLVTEYDVRPGGRLVTVNTFRRADDVAADLAPGPEYQNWSNFHPMVAEFLTDDADRVRELHRLVPEKYWQRARVQTVELLKRRPPTPRDGRPRYAVHPV